MNTSITDAALNAAVTKEKAATLDKIVQDNKERGLAERNYYAGGLNVSHPSRQRTSANYSDSCTCQDRVRSPPASVICILCG